MCDICGIDQKSIDDGKVWVRMALKEKKRQEEEAERRRYMFIMLLIFAALMTYVSVMAMFENLGIIH